MEIKIFKGDYDKSEFYAIMGKYFAERKYRKELPYIINEDGKNWLLFFDNNELVSFCSTIEHKKHYVVGSVYVLENKRNKKYCTKMLKEIVEEFDNKDLKIVTNAENLIKVLISLDFKETNMRGTYTTYTREVVPEWAKR